MIKSSLFAAGVVVALSACASAPPTAWGKAGVTKPEFGNDIGMCTGISIQQSGGNGTNTAGGVSGRNDNSSAGAATGGVGSGTPSGGTYQGMTSGDYAQRAATQQRSQEMAAKRLRADAYRNCLVQRGYKEFTLTPEQGAQLAKLKSGSEEYYEYLYKLGSDPKNVNK